MKLYLIGLGAAGLISFAALAADQPLALKCVTEDGTEAADLFVDLRRKTMQWGPMKYQITSSTEKYITGISIGGEIPSEVGGEVWVLDRVSGDYKRASVHMGVSGPNSPLSSARLSALTYSGRCGRKLL